MATESEFVQLAGMALALEMMGRAYEALALLYELRHPGEYSQQSRDLKDYVAGNFRHVEQDLKGGELETEAFRNAVLRVRRVFERVDAEIQATRAAASAQQT